MLYQKRCGCIKKIVVEIPDAYPKNIRELRLYSVVYTCVHCGDQEDVFRVDKHKPLICQKCGKKLSDQAVRYQEIWINRDHLPEPCG